MGNVLCEMLGIDYPILLGGMLFVGRSGLVAAVSEAGGLGVLGAGAMGIEELKEEIGRIKAQTDRPFGLNIPVRRPKAELLIQVAAEESVKVVTTSAGDPFRYTKLLKEAGIAVIHVIPTVAHALRAEEAGVDAVVAEGSESGGYINTEEVTTLALVPQVVDAVSIPVIAAGGIADARGFVAALALGAAGIQMGTRFLATEESIVPEDYKRALVLAKDTDTTVVRGQRAAHRDLKKELLQRVSSESEQNRLIQVEEMVERFEKEEMKEYPKDGVKWAGRSAGQSAGLVREILPVKEVIDRIMEGAGEILGHLPRRLG